MSTIRIPAGDQGVTIEARADKAREITATGAALYLFPTPPVGSRSHPTQEALGAGQTTDLTSPTRVVTQDGTQSKVRAKWVGRRYDFPDEAA